MKKILFSKNYVPKKKIKNLIFLWVGFLLFFSCKDLNNLNFNNKFIENKIANKSLSIIQTIKLTNPSGKNIFPIRSVYLEKEIQYIFDIKKENLNKNHKIILTFNDEKEETYEFKPNKNVPFPISYQSKSNLKRQKRFAPAIAFVFITILGAGVYGGISSSKQVDTHLLLDPNSNPQFDEDEDVTNSQDRQIVVTLPRTNLTSFVGNCFGSNSQRGLVEECQSLNLEEDLIERIENLERRVSEFENDSSEENHFSLIRELSLEIITPLSNIYEVGSRPLRMDTRNNFERFLEKIEEAIKLIYNRNQVGEMFKNRENSQITTLIRQLNNFLYLFGYSSEEGLSSGQRYNVLPSELIKEDSIGNSMKKLKERFLKLSVSQRNDLLKRIRIARRGLFHLEAKINSEISQSIFLLCQMMEIDMNIRLMLRRHSNENLSNYNDQSQYVFLLKRVIANIKEITCKIYTFVKRSTSASAEHSEQGLIYGQSIFMKTAENPESTMTLSLLMEKLQDDFKFFIENINNNKITKKKVEALAKKYGKKLSKYVQAIKDRYTLATFIELFPINFNHDFSSSEIIEEEFPDNQYAIGGKSDTKNSHSHDEN